jgi:ribA/ribD-fused uncharacterized protein
VTRIDVPASHTEESTVGRGETITRFSSGEEFLSNFSAHPVHWDGITYRTAEAAFQAGKTLDPTERARIAAAPTPAAAKRIGQTLTLRPGWDDKGRHEVMRHVLAAKFTVPDLAARLLATGTTLLVEGNTWCDQFWGCCTCPHHRAIPGRNWLGRYLMQLRTGLAPDARRGRWGRVACTGHRPHLLPPGCEDWLAAELRRVAAKLVSEHGTEVAISGAATGSDLLWAEAGHAAGTRVWLYQPYPGHDARWESAWADRLATVRTIASRVATLGTRYSVEVLHARSDWMLRDCDALVAVVDPHRRTGGTVAALQRVWPGTPVIHVDVRHRRTTIDTGR